MANEMYIQAAMFPEYPVIAYAYEIEAMKIRWWEAYDESDTMIASIEVDDFGDFLDFMRSINYDVLINTMESWEAMDDYSSF